MVINKWVSQKKKGWQRNKKCQRHLNEDQQNKFTKHKIHMVTLEGQKETFTTQTLPRKAN